MAAHNLATWGVNSHICGFLLPEIIQSVNFVSNLELFSSIDFLASEGEDNEIG